MLDQRWRRWADVVQMLYKCFVSAGKLCDLIVYPLDVVSRHRDPQLQDVCQSDKFRADFFCIYYSVGSYGISWESHVISCDLRFSCLEFYADSKK